MTKLCVTKRSVTKCVCERLCVARGARRRRKPTTGYRTKNKNPTQRCAERPPIPEKIPNRVRELFKWCRNYARGKRRSLRQIELPGGGNSQFLILRHLAGECVLGIWLGKAWLRGQGPRTVNKHRSKFMKTKIGRTVSHRLPFRSLWQGLKLSDRLYKLNIFHFIVVYSPSDVGGCGSSFYSCKKGTYETPT